MENLDQLRVLMETCGRWLRGASNPEVCASGLKGKRSYEVMTVIDTNAKNHMVEKQNGLSKMVLSYTPWHWRNGCLSK